MRALSAAAGDATQARILDAALAQFEEFGLRRTTMEDVARKAGVHRVTVYRRFDGKDTLVEVVLLRELRRFIEVFSGALQGVEGLEEQVVRGWVVTLRYARENRLLQRLMVIEPEVLMPYLTVRGGPYGSEATSFLAGHLRAAPDAAPWVAADPEAAAETGFRLVLSFVLNPDSAVPLADEQQMRAYARLYLAPLVTGRPPN